MTRVSRCIVVVALVGTTISACGARSGLPVPDIEPETMVQSDGATCAATDVAVEPNVPNLYFVLDISRSMLVDSKWDNVRQAAAGLIGELGPNARFGAAVFPDPAGLAMSNNCARGAEVMHLRLGDSQGMTANAFLAATAVTPNGGTPTAATLEMLLPILRGLRGPTFAILATDGGPNCNPAIGSCPINQCTLDIDNSSPPQCAPNSTMNCCDPAQGGGTMAGTGCLDGDATAQAVRDLRAAGVQTYVMGIPGSSPYGSVLDGLAIAGGTARAGEPRYYAVNSPDEAALASGFRDIAASAMRSCLLSLRDQVTNPNKVNVYLNGAVLPNGPDGWSIDGQTITLQGMTCSDFAMGPDDAGPPPVHVTQGCPTVH